MNLIILLKDRSQDKGYFVRRRNGYRQHIHFFKYERRRFLSPALPIAGNMYFLARAKKQFRHKAQTYKTVREGVFYCRDFTRFFHNNCNGSTKASTRRSRKFHYTEPIVTRPKRIERSRRGASICFICFLF